MRKRRWSLWLLLLLFLSALIFSFAPYFAKDRALLLIRVYDRYQEKNSIQEDIGLELDFPLGMMDFFPMLVTYNDEGLAKHLGKPIKFTVEYSFADFTHGKSSSQIYDKNDPLYNAYIGSYSLAGFGEKLSERDLMLISEYDMLHLALPAVGLSAAEGTFEILELEKKEQDLNISSYPFITYESTVLTNGPEHQGGSFVPGDLLFGSSPETDVDYPLIEMKGKIYQHYFAEQDLNLIFYTFGTTDEVSKEFEEKVINNIMITFK
ncbi:MAG TPA: hypothetical protein VLM88_01300 [Proteiniclasticum sp.]|nr:hypothetical protein [Proteiniclasticum sp.]